MFIQFSNSTTGYAEEVMENFYHVGSGTRLPRGGDALEETNGALDIGSASFYWKNLYTDNLIAYSTIASDNIIKRVYDNIVSSTTTRIEISGLNGDSHDYILSIFFFNTSGSDMLLRMNGNSTLVDHITKYVLTEGTSGTISSDQTTGTYFEICHRPVPSTCSFFYGTIFGKTGKTRIIDGMEMSQSTVPSCYRITHLWNESGTTLTSIVLAAANMAVGTRIILWET